MNFRKNLTCCVSSPICHFVLLVAGTLSVIQLVHTHAHYQMEMDADSYVRQFCKKNKDYCKTLLEY